MFFKTVRRFDQLTDTQKDIVWKKWFDTARPVGDWLKILQGLAEFDIIGDFERPRAGCLGMFLVFLGAMLFIIARHDLGDYSGEITGGLVLGGFLVLWRWSTLESMDLPNVLREFTLPVLRLIGQDVEPGEPIHLRMDLRGSCIVQKQTRENNFDAGGDSYPKLKEKWYRDAWLHLKTRLSDGSRLTFEVTDLIRRREVTRRGARRVKTKTKFKIKRVLKLWLELSRKHYTVEVGGAEARGKRDLIRLTNVSMHTQLNAGLDVGAFASLMGEAYRKIEGKAPGS